MFPQFDKSLYDCRALNQNWSYQPMLVGRAIAFKKLATADRRNKALYVNQTCMYVAMERGQITSLGPKSLALRKFSAHVPWPHTCTCITSLKMYMSIRASTFTKYCKRLHER